MEKEIILRQAYEHKQSDGSVDIIQLASIIGIGVYGSEASDDFNAEITHIQSEDKFEILVNTKHSLNRQRFSIAHELSHFVLHADRIRECGSLKRSFDSNDPTYSPDMEKAADELAGELLMPEELLREEFPLIFEKNPVLSFERIKEISIKFKVSILVAAIRLRNLQFNVPYISFSYS